jgi:GNAT superfamily N-acetyltransferase
MPSIQLASTDKEINDCFAAMVELRPHLIESDFLGCIRNLEQSGYKLAYLHDGGHTPAVAGFHIFECLSRPRYLYVDDLVTHSSARRRGYAALLLDWLVAYAREAGCDSLHLDSGPNRTDAHRFYEAHDMIGSTRHYYLTLT